AGSPSPPPDSACYTTCAALCTTRQPNSANRIRYPAPKPASHQPIRQPSHNIKQGAGPTSSHIYTAAETPPLDIVDRPESLGRGNAFGSDIAAAAVNTSQRRLDALSPSLIRFAAGLMSLE